MNIMYKTLALGLLLAVGVGCGYSKPKTVMPAISQLNPASEKAGSGQFQLEVDGMNFSSNAVVQFNGVNVPTTVVSSTKVEAMVPASAIMSTGTVPVTVTNPGSGGIYGNVGTVSAAMNFTIN